MCARLTNHHLFGSNEPKAFTHSTCRRPKARTGLRSVVRILDHLEDEPWALNNSAWDLSPTSRFSTPSALHFALQAACSPQPIVATKQSSKPSMKVSTASAGLRKSDRICKRGVTHMANETNLRRRHPHTGATLSLQASVEEEREKRAHVRKGTVAVEGEVEMETQGDGFISMSLTAPLFRRELRADPLSRCAALGLRTILSPSFLSTSPKPSWTDTCTNSPLYIDQSSRRIALPVNGWAARTTDLPMGPEPNVDLKLEGSRAIFVDDKTPFVILKDGSLYPVEVGAEGKTVTRLTLGAPLAQTAPGWRRRSQKRRKVRERLLSIPRGSDMDDGLYDDDDDLYGPSKPVESTTTAVAVAPKKMKSVLHLSL
ncbi:hypothetical protein DFP72DRAFT_1076565 [Ephemerocybe angulata]|uniref:Uncharacterized protein n=1 Tax=Ephemerocybe angulata TaxID=980116 RepID=A0A8H6HG35_9AGAR|nr:hypothetical protein DFP72DRAFT_1076565 [Tulosesus angulatus]